MRETLCTIQQCSWEPQNKSQRNRSNRHDKRRAFGVTLRPLGGMWSNFLKIVWIKIIFIATQNLFQWQHRTSRISTMAPNLNSDEYYTILGVPRSASDAQIKKAYKKLAVKVCCWLAVGRYVPVVLSSTQSWSQRLVGNSFRLDYVFSTAVSWIQPYKTQGRNKKWWKWI